MAYETFAFVYDEVMDESLYQKWLDFSNRHLPQGTQQILEMACGSGALAVDLRCDSLRLIRRNVDDC